MTESALEKLTALASNLWWSWHPEALELFQRLNPTAFRKSGNNPLVTLRSARHSVLSDPQFQNEVDGVYASFEAYMTEASGYTDEPKVAYFCMEYGLHESLPLYAGGLGVLAGDHLKAASDLGVPFTAIGLYLKDGYFNQYFDDSGWQHQAYQPTDADCIPATLVRDEKGRIITAEVHIGEQPITLQAWKVQVGRVSLYLLDTDHEDNPEPFRNLAHRLYQGGTEARIQKEVVVGIGGVRLLRAIGLEPDVYHLNEGHCAFLTLELLRECLNDGRSLSDSTALVRSQSVFTTHTPVPAGHDRFDAGLFIATMSHFARSMNMSDRELLAYGRVNPEDDGESFNMTVLALKMTRRANGVSRLHGEVSRRMWHELWSELPIEQIPIGHITNGVHLPTWTVRAASDFLQDHLGDWQKHQMDPDFWQGVYDIPDEELWEWRCQLRLNLINFINARLQRQTLPQVSRLHPDALTLGFARRFATYKRAPLLFSDEEQVIRMFTQHGRPIQIIFAGKAHPADEGGKSFIQRIYQMAQHPALKGRVLFLENYSIEIGRALVSGADVWLNNPRRPMEASGTSGQKVAMHGGLNVSILDGWWPEGYNGQNGWAIGTDASAEVKNPWEQDEEDARLLYETFFDGVIPTFFDRDESDLPLKWIKRMKNAMATLPHQFSTHRMVRDYIENVYRA